MKKIILLMMISWGLLAACHHVTIAAEPMPTEELEREIEPMVLSEHPGVADIRILVVERIAQIREDTNPVELVRIHLTNYRLDEGLFHEDRSLVIPAEIRFELDEENGGCELKEVLISKGDVLNAHFIKRISRGHADWESALKGKTDSFAEIYLRKMEKLAEICNEKGLVYDELSDYEKSGWNGEDMIRVSADMSNYPEQTIIVAGRSEYESAVRRKAEGKEKWPHYNCLIYHQPTGIAVHATGDFPIDIQ